MKNILDEVRGIKSIGITGHVSPDGDCIGSCMALYYYLKEELQNTVEIDIYLESVPSEFAFLEDTNIIRSDNEDEKTYDVFFALDSGDLKRIGFAKKYFLNAKKRINIDHHISNTNYGDINHVITNASSTCEVLYDLFKEDKITEEIAIPLYIGIVHDTGILTYDNTSEKTLNIVGKLINKDIPFNRIVDETYRQKTFLQNQLLGRCLLDSNLYIKEQCIISHISRKTMSFYGAKSTDLGGIVDQLRLTKGVEVAIFIHQLKDNDYKVSMRSNNLVNVQKIASHFGGGGHIKAAGCVMSGSIKDIIKELTFIIEKELLEKGSKD